MCIQTRIVSVVHSASFQELWFERTEPPIMYKLLVISTILASSFAAPKPGIIAHGEHPAPVVTEGVIATYSSPLSVKTISTPAITSYSTQTLSSPLYRTLDISAFTSYSSPLVATVSQPTVTTYSVPHFVSSYPGSSLVSTYSSPSFVSTYSAPVGALHSPPVAHHYNTTIL